MLSWTQATLSRGYDELQDQWGASGEPVPGSYRGLTWSVQLALSSEGWEGGGGGEGGCWCRSVERGQAVAEWTGWEAEAGELWHAVGGALCS